jgi:hypothetical protein
MLFSDKLPFAMVMVEKSSGEDSFITWLSYFFNKYPKDI